MMKRVIALVLSCVLLACVFALPGTAASAATITVGTVSGQVGDIVELPVSIATNSYLVNADLLIAFDATRLELVDDHFAEGCYQTGSILGSKWTCVGNGQTAGRFWFYIATGNNTGLTAGGELFRIALRILKDDVQSIAVTVTADPIRGNDGTGAVDENGYPADFDLSCSAIAGAVTIGTTTTTPSDKLIGDLNFDGRITLRDVLVLYSGIRNSLSDDCRAVADYNGDGTINMRDVLKLYAYVSGAVE